MTNTTNEKSRGFNFKKAFLIFFAALLVFTAISVIYGLSTGGWESAVSFQSSAIDARSSGDISTIFGLAAERAQLGSRTIGDRALFGIAGFTTRISSADFTIFHFIGTLFQIAFVALIGTFIYTKVQKHRKSKMVNEHQQHSENNTPK